MAVMNFTTSTLQLKHCTVLYMKVPFPFLPLGGDNSLFKSCPLIVPTPVDSSADFQLYIELLSLLSMGKCFGNHNAKVLFQW